MRFNPENFNLNTNESLTVKDNLKKIIALYRSNPSPENRENSFNLLINEFRQGTVDKKIYLELMMGIGASDDDVRRFEKKFGHVDGQAVTLQEMTDYLLQPETAVSVTSTKERIEVVEPAVETISQVEIEYTNDLLVPPESENMTIETGSGNGIEERLLPKTNMLLSALMHAGLTSPEDFYLIKTKNNEALRGTFRQTDYQMIVIPDLEKMILVCDKYGEASYIVSTPVDNETPKKYYSMSKVELASQPNVERVEWTGKAESWTEKILDLLFSNEEPIQNQNGTSEKLPQIGSDFTVEIDGEKFVSHMYIFNRANELEIKITPNTFIKKIDPKLVKRARTWSNQIIRVYPQTDIERLLIEYIERRRNLLKVDENFEILIDQVIYVSNGYLRKKLAALNFKYNGSNILLKIPDLETKEALSNGAVCSVYRKTTVDDLITKAQAERIGLPTVREDFTVTIEGQIYVTNKYVASRLADNGKRKTAQNIYSKISDDLTRKVLSNNTPTTAYPKEVIDKLLADFIKAREDLPKLGEIPIITIEDKEYVTQGYINFALKKAGTEARYGSITGRFGVDKVRKIISHGRPTSAFPKTEVDNYIVELAKEISGLPKVRDDYVVVIDGMIHAGVVYIQNRFGELGIKAKPTTIIKSLDQTKSKMAIYHGKPVKVFLQTEIDDAITQLDTRRRAVKEVGTDFSAEIDGRSFVTVTYIKNAFKQAGVDVAYVNMTKVFNPEETRKVLSYGHIATAYPKEKIDTMIKELIDRNKYPKVDADFTALINDRRYVTRRYIELRIKGKDITPDTVFRLVRLTETVKVWSNGRLADAHPQVEVDKIIEELSKNGK